MSAKDEKTIPNTKGRGLPFGHAFRGILETYRYERNFRTHLIVAIIAIALGFWLDLTATEWPWIIVSIAFVLVSELLNTAIEALVDLASPDYHVLAKRAKDAAAAAVLVAAIAAVILGSLIFIPKLWAMV